MKRVTTSLQLQSCSDVARDSFIFKLISMNIYITNLHNTIDNQQLNDLFSPYGNVESAEVVKDVFNGSSRGFGYVNMDDEAAGKAIAALNGTTVEGLVVSVQEAPEKKEQKGSYKVGTGAINAYRFKKS